MSEKELQDWKSHNQLLQKYYQVYCSVRNLNDRSSELKKQQALERIIRELESCPLKDYVLNKVPTFPSGIRRNGLDWDTERCIGEIDKIANGEILV